MTSKTHFISREFPTLADGKLIYLDSAATSLKPHSVIDAMTDFYRHHYATVHRTVYELGLFATKLYQDTKQKTADFIHAESSDEIIYTKNATEALNLLSFSLSREILKEGDEILLSVMEHHSNIVPWQAAAKMAKAKIVYVDVTCHGSLDLEDFERKYSDRTKIVSLCHVSNVLGTINPIHDIAKIIRRKNAIFILDGAQAVCHLPIDVQNLDVDFYVFSAHKMYGPTGIGVLWGKKRHLQTLPPFLMGGDMVSHVSLEKTLFQEAPLKFEAGTPPIVEAIGLQAAIDFLGRRDPLTCKPVYDVLYEGLCSRENVHIIGAHTDKVPIISFHVDGVHAMDLGSYLGIKNIAIRTGSLCAQPLINRFGYTSLSRISLGIYNTLEDIEQFFVQFDKALQYLQH